MRIKLITSIVSIFFLSLGCDNEDTYGDQNGVTFINLIVGNNSGFELDSTIVNYQEILGYDSTDHIFLLSNSAGERIKSVDYPVVPTRFAIALNGEIIYIASFIPGYSSISCSDCITVEPYSHNNRYRISLGYPASGSYSGIDPRNDERIISRLMRDNKLYKIQK